MVPAIVLAAGASSRMGRTKALLSVGNRTFVRNILASLQAGGVDTAVVVVRPELDGVADEVDATGFGRPVVNPQPERGQFSSLLTGLDAVDRPGVDAVLVTLVDIPLLAPATVATLLARAALTRAPIVRAVHRGRHGHPVIFSRVLFPAVRAADPGGGAKPILRAFEVENVEVDDPGVTRDVDTPGDYARLTI